MNKSRFAGITAAVTLASGIALATAGFIVEPTGEISDSVLMYTAQTLIYAGSVLGVNVAIDEKIRRIRDRTKEEMK